MIKYLLLAVLATQLTGCGTVSYYDVKKAAMGYKPHDPCIRCGEKWQQLPNWQHEAVIRRNRGEQW
jgi:hypothetical protein